MDSDVRQICERPRQLAVFVSKVDFFAWQKGSKTSLLKKATAEDAGPIFENDTPVKSRFRKLRPVVAENAGRSQPVDATPSELEVVFMKQGRRYGLSVEQKADIWRRWRAG